MTAGTNVSELVTVQRTPAVQFREPVLVWTDTEVKLAGAGPVDVNGGGGIEGMKVGPVPPDYCPYESVSGQPVVYPGTEPGPSNGDVYSGVKVSEESDPGGPLSVRGSVTAGDE